MKEERTTWRIERKSGGKKREMEERKGILKEEERIGGKKGETEETREK